MFENIHLESIEDFFINESLLSLIDSMEDGVSVLTPDLSLVYVNDTMRRWYNIASKYPNEKCYKAYHGSDVPCEDCPAVEAMKMNLPSWSLERACKDNRECISLIAEKYLITNKEGEVILIIGITKDLTLQKAMEKQIDDLRESFEILKKQNELLIQSLQMRERQFDELNETIQANLEYFVRPSLEHLKKKVDEDDLQAVSSVIDQVVFPVTKKRIPRLKELSPREMQVAALVKEGLTSKQIADQLFISKKAVDFHRLNIRKKLGLSADDNLQRYLEIHI